MIAYFEHDGDGDDKNKSYVNSRLINSANYSCNICNLEQDRDFKTDFNAMFKRSNSFDKNPETNTGVIMEKP